MAQQNLVITQFSTSGRPYTTGLGEDDLDSAFSKIQANFDDLYGGAVAELATFTGDKYITNRLYVGNAAYVDPGEPNPLGFTVAVTDNSPADQYHLARFVRTITGDVSQAEHFGLLCHLWVGTEVGGSNGFATDNLDVNRPAVVIETGWKAHCDAALPKTYENIRCIDLDGRMSGYATVNRVEGATARCHGGSTNATLGKFTGFRAVGPVSTDYAGGTGSTLNNYVGFQAGFDDRSGVIVGIVNDYVGVQIDNSSVVPGVINVGGVQRGLWLNGEGSGSDVVFGPSAEMRMLYSSPGNDFRFISTLPLRFQGAQWWPAVGTGAAPALPANLPTGYLANTVKFFEIEDDTGTAYALCAWSKT